MKKNIANFITSIRLVGAIVLIFLETLSKPFFVVYIISGISDAVDGFVARKLNITSEFGSKLDSVSDILFNGIVLIKVFPYLLRLTPAYIKYLIYIVVGMRLLCYLYVGYIYKKFSSRHTIYNKITSLLLFLLPFAVLTKYLTIYCLIVLMIGFISNIDEIIYIKKHLYA